MVYIQPGKKLMGNMRQWNNGDFGNNGDFDIVLYMVFNWLVIGWDLAEINNNYFFNKLKQ